MKTVTKKYLLMLLAVLFVAETYGQQRRITRRPAYVKGVPELKVGDSFPNISLGKISGGSKSTVRANDFKDQLLILDFWDTYCGSCIQAMPRMGRLQKIFGSRIRILPVTWQDEQTVREFWKSNKYTKGIDLPGVVEDSILYTYFRHHSVPHEIWVYQGKVIGITDGEHVDEKNIRALLAGEKPSLPLKYDFYAAYDNRTPLFKTDSAQLAQQAGLRYAAIKDYQPGMPDGWNAGEGIFRDSVQKNIRVYLLNSPIWMAYFTFLLKIHKTEDMATPEVLGKRNMTLWDVADRSMYRYKLYDTTKAQGYTRDWIMDHAICFEGFYPEKGQREEQIYGAAIKDMNRLLGLDVRWEKRKEKVYVIRDRGQSLRIQAKASPGNSALNLYELESYWNDQENYPYLFVESIKADKGKLMDLDTGELLSNIPALKVRLESYGLELQEEERLVDRIIFAEVEGGLLLEGKTRAVARAEKEAQKEMAGPPPEEGIAFLKANRVKPGVVTLRSGLQYRILKKGNGPVPDSSSRVTVRYTGTLVNGKIFDSSALQGRPLTVKVKEVIPGWTEALQLMPVGSRWMLYVPSELAYATHSNSGQLPRSSVLVFEMEVLRVMK